MPSMRCTMCSIDYPVGMNVCPVCKDQTWFNKSTDPDELWEWQAEQARQARLRGEYDDGPYVGLQPYFLNIKLTEIIHVAEVEDDEDGGLSKAPLTTTPAAGLIDVYAFRDQKLLLKPDDVIEVPNEAFRKDAAGKDVQPPTKLYEVQGTFRGQSTTMYMLRELTVPDVVPDEWVEEFYRGD